MLLEKSKLKTKFSFALGSLLPLNLLDLEMGDANRPAFTDRGSWRWHHSKALRSRGSAEARRETTSPRLLTALSDAGVHAGAPTVWDFPQITGKVNSTLQRRWPLATLLRPQLVCCTLMECPEETNLWRQLADLLLPGARRRRWKGELMFNRYCGTLFLYFDEDVLELDNWGGCTDLWINYKWLNCAL